MLVGVAFVAILGVLGLGQMRLEETAAAQAKNGVTAPDFEVDPFWPTSMPQNAARGTPIVLRAGDVDRVWIIRRGNDPETLHQSELSQPANVRGGVVSVCRDPAPRVLEFAAEGNLVGHWGGPAGGYE